MYASTNYIHCELYFNLTCWGCVSWLQYQEAPSAAQRSLERRPWWCLAGDAHAGTGTGLESAWLPVHSGVAPSAEGVNLPVKIEKQLVRF